MSTTLTMPKLGLTMTEGTVSKWLKKEGDAVTSGEALFVVSTDKITYEVTAEREGLLLKVYVEENGSVPVGAPVAVIGDQGEAVEDSHPVSGDAPVPVEESKEKPREVERPATVVSSGKVKATPKARKTAKEKGIDLRTVVGSGPDGRIKNKDVLAAGPKASPVAAKMAKDLGVDLGSIDRDGRIMKSDVLSAAAGRAQEDSEVPMTAMRRIIAQRMLESTQTIPTVTYEMDLDCTAMIALREKAKPSAAKAGAKITYNDIIMMACAKVLVEQPMCNSSVDMEGQRYILHSSVNIGLAVAVEGGLLVPNVKDVQDKSLLEVAASTDELVQRSRENRLLPQDMEGGTFTISNLGMFGMRSFTPIVNPPESCILAVNAMEDRAVVVDGQVVVRTMTTLCLTADHRSVDGADAAKFLARLKELLESPVLLLL
ncbi:MAG: 2-oxo acid dehydrogenase subunit E2 [Synergistales bacterium]|nr:2-oxo acid dehydrogenase subunit E2 [Synergistales bacterium]